MNPRQQSILDRFEQQESCSYEELAKLLGVSTMTIRRDVDALARRGAVVKALRGCRKAQDTPAAVLYETTLASRMTAQVEEKRAIARMAMELLGERQSVYLDGGTTCLELARAIAARSRGLTIVTNSALVCLEAGGNGHNTVVTAGGQYDAASASFVGPVAEETVGKYFVDVAFFSTKGLLVREGTFESSMPAFRIKQIVAARCKELLLLVDHTKFGQRALTKVLDISRIHGVVTDRAAPRKYVAALRKAGKQVWLASDDRKG